ncbi:MAG: glycosyltransferase family 2 protein [Clostridia bacterium]|nr:glycosyltransferase family 2 protein [Clostridia bacterium]
MKKEKVSVVIPAYNAEPFIDRAINSALNQTHDNVEIVVINDGSKDKTEEKVKTYTEKYDNIKLISTDNGGVCRARNIGIDNSTGNYISFLDADDELLPDAIELMLDIALKNDADIVNAKKSEEDGVLPEELSLTGEEFLIKCIEDHHIGYSVRKLFKKAFLGADVRFKEGRKIHEDSFFCFTCALKQPKVIHTEKNVYKVYPTEGSASRGAFSEKYFDILYFAQKKEELISKLYPHLKDKIVNLRIKANMALLLKMCTGRAKGYKKTEKELIKYIIKNKKSFAPAIAFDKKWFSVITHRMYFIYKFLYKIKHRG